MASELTRERLVTTFGREIEAPVFADELAEEESLPEEK